jgi:hypothetical protein
MSTINEAFIDALLADAAYVNVTPLSNLATALAERMTPTLAQYIAYNFTVASVIDTSAVSAAARSRAAVFGCAV